jgi:hypothetical protein
VHCYEGDAHQVVSALGLYTHHQCPVTVISPIDSPVTIDGVDCRFAGVREGSTGRWAADFNQEGSNRIVTGGPIANARQIAQMKKLLECPENFFLMNDSDSMCLDAKIPDYLYAEPDIVWSNLVHDPMPINQPGYPHGFPRLALQPPYFLSRRTIGAMISVAHKVVTNSIMPWIDHYMLQLAVEAKLVWKGFPDGVSTDLRHPGHLEWAQVQVRHLGRIMLHSAKSTEDWGPLVHAHNQFVADYRGAGDHRLNPDTNTTADIAPPGKWRRG